MEEEPGVGCCTELDTFQMEVAQAVYLNGGGLITSQGGAGKSHIIRHIRALCEADGVRCDTVGFTHVQAANVDGATLLHDVHRNALVKRRCLICDEAGQIPLRLWGIIATMKYTGTILICLGDFRSQLPPIADQHQLELWKALPSSDFMHSLCNGLHAKLAKFRRRKLCEKVQPPRAGLRSVIMHISPSSSPSPLRSQRALQTRPHFFPTHSEQLAKRTR